MAETVSYRAHYHHGDARAALIKAALDLARAGGPRTVTLRAAARDVGVTAAAVYRHFATVEELLVVVRDRALAMLADRVDATDPRPAAETASAASTAETAPATETTPATDTAPPTETTAATEAAPATASTRSEPAAARVRAVAEGYVAFARETPGLFGMACHGGLDAVRELVAERLGAQRPGLGLAVWSVAHGVAALAADGSLREMSEPEQRACLAGVLDIVVAGAGSLEGSKREEAGTAHRP
jgi:AcrR family transcriptional regulator